MRIFEKKAVKSPQRRGAPNSVCLSRLGAEPSDRRVVTSACQYNFVQFDSNSNANFIAPQRRKNNYSKCPAFASFALFAPIFHFKLRSFF